MSNDPEKAGGLSTSLPVDSNAPHHHHRLNARARLRHFLHPSGTRVHIADSPIEANQLHRQLSNNTDQSPHEPFSVYISGSPEHLSAVRETHSHHQERQASLRNAHGEVWDQFAEVQSELDRLSRELGRVAEKGVVGLEGHFGRFGYSATIKSYDDDDGGSSPGAGSLREGGSGEGEEAPALKLFKVPVVRQYFHRGILWRASGCKEVSSFELFVDLLYVGIIAINGDAAAEEPTGFELLKFIITFTLSWKIWNDMAMIIAWFETDDIFQRVSILFLLACLFGYTTNIVEAFSETYATLIGFFLAARLYMTAYLFLTALLVPMIRPVMLYYCLIALLNAALWIASIHVSYPNQLALILPALFLEICGQTSYIALLTLAHRLPTIIISPALKARTTKALDFHPALNIEHRVERTNAFVSLVFGYTVVAILYQTSSQGITALFGKAILALIQPFAFNWLYFELDADRLLATHAIRRAKISAALWSLAHLLFIMSFVLGGGALARLVLASDIEGVRVEDLTETYQGRSEGEVRRGVRWFYCAGFGSALLLMGAISVSHVHKDLKGMRLSKGVRLGFRAAAGVVMILLPLAGEKLDSLGLVATMTGLVCFSLVVEVWGASRKGTGFGSGGGGKPRGYVGRCGKRDLQAVLGEDGRVDVDALGERRQGAGLASMPM